MPERDEFEEEFEQLNGFLLEHGWLLPPGIIGGELHALRDRCAKYQSLPDRDTPTRKAALVDIEEVLVLHASHPNVRAAIVWLAMKQPHMKTFSHLIENGTIHYYRRDYISSVLCLLPAVEGVLLSHFTESRPDHKGKIRHEDLIGFLKEDRPASSHPGRHRVYRTALGDFLAKWLWCHTKKADWDLSNLNRHYAVHGLGPRSFYRSADCERLFTYFELYGAMLTLETGIGADPWWPFQEEDQTGFERRVRYYEQLNGWSEVTRTWSRREALLREHESFKHEDPKETFFERLERWAHIMHLDRPRRVDDARDRPRRR